MEFLDVSIKFRPSVKELMKMTVSPTYLEGSVGLQMEGKQENKRDSGCWDKLSGMDGG